jgi:predicted RNase H-like HicB family nuclease
MDDKRSYISRGGILMKFKVKLERSDEGVAASVPGLPGCWSQGETEDEAMRNIEDAIREYLDVIAEQLRGAEVREIEIAV